MSNFSVEDRTRTYQPRQDVYLRRGPGDEAFESQLPPEVRTELEGRFAPTSEVFLRPAPRSPWRPGRIPETEAEIAEAIQWLKSQGYLRSADPAPSPTPPPVMPSPLFVAPPPPPVIPPVYRPAQSAPRRGTGIWWWLLLLIGIAVLGSHLPKTTSTRLFASTGSQIGPRRALPVVPRALPVTTPGSILLDLQIGQWHPIRFSDGTVVQACYRGQLPSTSLLPGEGAFIGDERVINNTSWIWMQPAGSHLASWVDP